MSKKDQPYTSKLKGVAALLREPPVAAAQVVAISSIRLPQQQPRRYFDPEKLEQLTISVKKLGILQPLLVRLRHPGEYELVAAERRYRAAQKAGLTEIPVVVRELTDARTISPAPAFFEAGFKKSFEFFLAQKNGKKMFLSDTTNNE